MAWIKPNKQILLYLETGKLSNSLSKSCNVFCVVNKSHQGQLHHVLICGNHSKEIMAQMRNGSSTCVQQKVRRVKNNIR